MYPYTRFGFSESQAVFVLICACVAIPLLHAVVESGIMYISRFFFGNAWDIFGYAALWVIGEWVLSLGSLAFPWGGTAVSLTGFLPYLQTVSLFGKYFITFITAAGCFAIAYAIFRKVRIFAVGGAGIILLNSLVGAMIWYTPVEKGDSFSVAAIQGNILSNEKWDSANNGTIFERYISMTENAAENGADLIILPESAIPQVFVPNGTIHKALSEISETHNVTIISGVHYYDTETGESYNAVIAVLPDGSGTLSERYDKRHLVPFGEFIPLVNVIGELFPFVAEFNEGTSDLTAGNEAVVIETEYGKIAPLVCFDSIFLQFASESVDDGAELLAVVTNDSWFNDSTGIYTHLRHSQLRAIENRRVVMRAANTGISAFIDEHGRILTQTAPLVRDTAYAEVYAIDSLTLYTQVGDVFLYISFIVILGFIFMNIISYIRRNKHGNNSTSSEGNI